MNDKVPKPLKIFGNYNQPSERRKRSFLERDNYFQRRKTDKQIGSVNNECSNAILETVLKVQMRNFYGGPNIVANINDLDMLGQKDNSEVSLSNGIFEKLKICDEREMNVCSTSNRESSMFDNYWKNQEDKTTNEPVNTLLESWNDDREPCAETDENKFNDHDLEFAFRFLPVPLMRRKEMKKLGLVKHASVYSCLSFEDQRALDKTVKNYTKLMETIRTEPLPKIAQKPRGQSVPSETRNKIKPTTERNQKRSRSAEPAVPLWWHMKKHTQQITKKSYKKLKCIDLEAMGLF